MERSGRTPASGLAHSSPAACAVSAEPRRGREESRRGKESRRGEESSVPLATLAKRCDSSPAWMAGEQSSPAWMKGEQFPVPLAPLAKHSRNFSWNKGLLGAPEAHGSSGPDAGDHSAGGGEEAEFDAVAATFPPMYDEGQPRQFFSTPAPHRHQPPPQNTPQSLPRQQPQLPHEHSHQPPPQQQQPPHKPQHQQNQQQQTQEGAAQARSGQSNQPPAHPQLSTHPPMHATPGCAPLAVATCTLPSPELPVFAAGAVKPPVTLFMPTPPKMPPPPHIKPVAIPSPNGNGAGTPVAPVGHASPPRGLPRLVLLLLCIFRVCELLAVLSCIMC